MPMSPYLRRLRERVGHELLEQPSVTVAVRDVVRPRRRGRLPAAGLATACGSLTAGRRWTILSGRPGYRSPSGRPPEGSR